MVLVEVRDKTAVVDLAEDVEVPQRQRMNSRGITVLLILLQRFLIHVRDSR